MYFYYMDHLTNTYVNPDLLQSLMTGNLRQPSSLRRPVNLFVLR